MGPEDTKNHPDLTPAGSHPIPHRYRWGGSPEHADSEDTYPECLQDSVVPGYPHGSLVGPHTRLACRGLLESTTVGTSTSLHLCEQSV